MKETDITVLSTSAPPTSTAEWSRYLATIISTPLGAKQILTGRVQSSGAVNTGTPAILELDKSEEAKTPDKQPANAIGFQTEVRERSVDITSRAYPHLLEEAQPALLLINQCLNDARAALDAYDDADIQSIGSRLTAIAAQCAKAHRLTRFNESFGAVVSFIRRATIAVNAAEVGRPDLNALFQALQRIVAEPMISLVDAAATTDALSNAGWQGEHGAVETLLALIVEGAPADVMEASAKA